MFYLTLIIVWIILIKYEGMFSIYKSEGTSKWKTSRVHGCILVVKGTI